MINTVHDGEFNSRVDIFNFLDFLKLKMSKIENVENPKMLKIDNVENRNIMTMKLSGIT